MYDHTYWNSDINATTQRIKDFHLPHTWSLYKYVIATPCACTDELGHDAVDDAGCSSKRLARAYGRTGASWAEKVYRGACMIGNLYAILCISFYGDVLCCYTCTYLDAQLATNH